MLFLALFVMGQILMPLVDEWLGTILAEYGFGKNHPGGSYRSGKSMAGAHESRLMEWSRAWTIFCRPQSSGLGWVSMPGTASACMRCLSSWTTRPVKF